MVEELKQEGNTTHQEKKLTNNTSEILATLADAFGGYSQVPDYVSGNGYSRSN